jgi:hypothetical protein
MYTAIQASKSDSVFMGSGFGPSGRPGMTPLSYGRDKP